MTELVFVDTNVLVYARNIAEVTKQREASRWIAALWHTERGRLSFQVLAEYYLTLTTKLRGFDPASVRADVRSFLAWSPVAVDLPLLEQAWRMQDRYRLSFWDALIASAAHSIRCRYLLTEDLQHQQRIEGVTVLNPFRTGPEMLR